MEKEDIKEAGGGEAATAVPITPTITYDEFSKLDIRLGTIVEVEIVKGADKLLRFQVDFGTQRLQILSGIREYFSNPQELVGKQSPFIVNLEPRMIRGLESQGMILAASDGDHFGLLTPHQPLKPGSQVV